MKLILALALLPLSALAQDGCSSCVNFGSPFGPGYSWSCYFVQESGRLSDIRRYETSEECRSTRDADPRCQGKETLPSPPRREDPCF